MDCIFCKIAKKQIPSAVLYEDKDFFAFLDIGPVNPGHTLVIPKAHYQTFLDLPKKELSNINIVSQKLAAAIMKATNAHGFNIVMNNHPAAGQEVNHAHFHIIPRFDDDAKWLRQPKTKYKDGEIDLIAAKIKSLL